MCWTPPESIRSKTMWSSIFKVQHFLLSNCYLGSLTRDFRSQFFFHESVYRVPQAPKYSIDAVLNFFENSRRYLRINVYHRCQRHRRKAVQRCQRHRQLVLVKDFQWSPVWLILGINYRWHLWPIIGGDNDTGDKFIAILQEQGRHGGGELSRIGESWRG